MAELYLRRHEVEQGELPMVCARCGEEATEWEDKKFTWHPGWMIILVILSLAIGFLLVMSFQKTMTATLPFCDRHRNHFRSRTRLLAATFFAVFALFAAGIGLMVLDPNNKHIAGPLIGLSIFSLMAWVILAVVVSRTAICPAGMSDSDITLKGLSEAFVQAVVQHRRTLRGDAPAAGEESDYDKKLRERRFQRLKKQMDDE